MHGDKGGTAKNPFLPENQPKKRLRYATQAVKAPKARPQRDLETLGFVGASQVQQARQRYQANVRAQHEPRAEPAGRIAPKPVPTNVTGLAPAQQKALAKAVGTQHQGSAHSPRITRAIRSTPFVAQALTEPLGKYLLDVPKEIATQKRTKRQEQAGIFYTSLLKEIPKQLGHDVTHPGVNLARMGQREGLGIWPDLGPRFQINAEALTLGLQPNSLPCLLFQPIYRVLVPSQLLQPLAHLHLHVGLVPGPVKPMVEGAFRGTDPQ